MLGVWLSQVLLCEGAETKEVWSVTISLISTADRDSFFSSQRQKKKKTTGGLGRILVLSSVCWGRSAAVRIDLS